MGSSFSHTSSENQNTSPQAQSEEGNMLLQNTINLATEIKNAIQQMTSPVTVTELYNKLTDVEKENTSLKKLLADQIEKNKILEHLKDENNVSNDHSKNGEVIKQKLNLNKIKEIVDKMLADKNVNIEYLPDFVERQIYINTFTILLGVLENVLETSKIEVLGQEIKININ